MFYPMLSKDRFNIHLHSGLIYCEIFVVAVNKPCEL